MDSCGGRREDAKRSSSPAASDFPEDGRKSVVADQGVEKQTVEQGAVVKRRRRFKTGLTEGLSHTRSTSLLNPQFHVQQIVYLVIKTVINSAASRVFAQIYA